MSAPQSLPHDPGRDCIIYASWQHASETSVEKRSLQGASMNEPVHTIRDEPRWTPAFAILVVLFC